MDNEKVFSMNAGKVYTCLVNKAVRKGRSAEEVDRVTCWLTGYEPEQLHDHLNKGLSYRVLFEQAPQINPDSSKITGSICGVKVQEIEDPLMRNIRYLDKLVDELAKGKSIDKILNR